MLEILKKFDLVPLDVQMILIVAVLFYVFTKVMGKLLFTPFLTLIEAREAATAGAQHDAEALEKETGELSAKYQARIRECAIEAQATRISLIEAAKNAADKEIAEAQAHAKNEVQQNNAAMEESVRAAKSRLEQEMPSLAAALVDRVKSQLRI